MLCSVESEAVKKRQRSRLHGQLVHRLRQANQLKIPLSKTESKGRRGAFQGGEEQPFNAGEPLPSIGEFCRKKKMSPSLLCGVGVCVHLVSRIADGLFTHQATTYPCKRYPHPSSLAGGFPFPYAFFKALYEDLKGECPPYGLTLWAESPIRVFPCRMTPV